MASESEVKVEKVELTSSQKEIIDKISKNDITGLKTALIVK